MMGYDFPLTFCALSQLHVDDVVVGGAIRAEAWIPESPCGA